LEIFDKSLISFIDIKACCYCGGAIITNFLSNIAKKVTIELNPYDDEDQKKIFNCNNKSLTDELIIY